VIDYLGASLLAAGVASIVLLTSLGGSTYGWGSPQIVGLGVVGVLLLIGWGLAERRAVEPIMPLRLFANKVFSITSAIGFVVGFALFGVISYLPAFLQVAKGADPTKSGLQLLPLMGGLILTSTLSGLLITRWGRYKVFPMVGTGLTAIGIYLLSTVGLGTPTGVMYLYMLVTGIGLGGVMQVLVIVVQNGVDHRDIGVATAGATFFRSIGGSIGTAVFGAIFANILGGRLASHLQGLKVPAGLGATISPGELDMLSAAVRHGVAAAYASTIGTVFLVAAPVAALAFLLTWFLPEVPMRNTIDDDAEIAAGEASDELRAGAASPGV
jgi:predicted MFS family arabinose efflux permease